MPVKHSMPCSKLHKEMAITLINAEEAGGNHHQLDGLGMPLCLRGWDEEDVHRYQQGLVNLGYVAI